MSLEINSKEDLINLLSNVTERLENVEKIQEDMTLVNESKNDESIDNVDEKQEEDIDEVEELLGLK